MVKTLQCLVQRLSRVVRTTNNMHNVGVVLGSYNGDDWKEHVYNDTYLTRNKIHSDSVFTLYAINWPIGYVSPIHGHPSLSGCWLMPVHGRLEEHLYHPQANYIYDMCSLRKGNVSFISDILGMHRIRNVGGVNAVSLHVYTPDQRGCHRYKRLSNDYVSYSPA